MMCGWVHCRTFGSESPEMARRQQCSIRTCCSTSIAGGGGVNNYQLRTGISLADSVCVTDNDIGDEGSQALFGGFKNNTVFLCQVRYQTGHFRFFMDCFTLTCSGYQRSNNGFGMYQIYLSQ